MESDVCKHCTHAACLDVCPTGALFRTEFGTVVVQEDVCNGCGYCVPACPFGVIDKRDLPRSADDAPLSLPMLGKKEDGRVWKCTLCYDRLKGGHEPACAKACPTNSIQFGELDELRERAEARLEKLEAQGWNGAAALRPRPGRRRRRLRRVLPAARRAGGLRPAARPGRRRPSTCRSCGGRPRSPRRRWSSAWRRRSSEGASDRVAVRTTAGRSSRSRRGQPEIPAYLFTGGIAGGCRCCTGSRA